MEVGYIYREYLHYTGIGINKNQMAWNHDFLTVSKAIYTGVEINIWHNQKK